MALKKLLNLFNDKPSKKAPKKVHAKAQEEPSSDNSVKDKAEIEQYRNAIQGKLKDPAMAKKAALIIEQMINKKTNKNDKAA